MTVAATKPAPVPSTKCRREILLMRTSLETGQDVSGSILSCWICTHAGRCTAKALWSGAGWPWQYADNGHHALILMVENVAVIYEVADIGPAKVHPNRDAGIRMGRVTIPVGNFDH